MSDNNRKEKVEIKIDSEEAIDNFGSEIFEQNIILFVEEGYNNFKEGIKKAQEDKDHSKMKINTHTLKTTARYMASENFALECQAIESETKAPNWEKINQLLPDFFQDLDILYNECVKIYNGIKGITQLKPQITIELNENKDKNFQNPSVGIDENNKVFTADREAKDRMAVSIKSSKTCNEDEQERIFYFEKKDEKKDDYFIEHTGVKMSLHNKGLSQFARDMNTISNSFISKKNTISITEETGKDVSNKAAELNKNAGASKFKLILPSASNSTNNLSGFSHLESYSPNPIGISHKVEKYTKLINDASAICEVLTKNKEPKPNKAYCLGNGTPRCTSSILEKPKNSLELTDQNTNINSESKNFKSKEEGSIFINRLEGSHSSSSLHTNVKNPKQCIKSLRDIDKPITGSYFKPKLDEKPKVTLTNQEFKSKFFERFFP